MFSILDQTLAAADRMVRREWLRVGGLSALGVCWPHWLRAAETSAGSVELISLKKTWSAAPHNGFPDLVRFQDRWFCCCREGERHVYGEDGKIRILVSQDGDAWESAALLTEEGVDLRDASLSEMPDGRLMLVCGGSVFEDRVENGKLIQKNGKFVTRWSYVAFSRDGRTWSPLQKILDEGHWLWRVTWHKGRAYGLAKTGHDADPATGLAAVARRGFLYSSADGLDWRLITEWGKPVAGSVSETRLRFGSDDEMIALVRPHFIGTSRPPYHEWTFRLTKDPLLGPNFVRLPDGSLWASTRAFQPLTEAEKAKTKKPSAAHTVLARITREGNFETALTLPSFGDTGYAGLVWHDNLLWMAYYSSHEGGTNIYLAKIKLNGIR